MALTQLRLQALVENMPFSGEQRKMHNLTHDKMQISDTVRL